ncbi:MAG: polysaccharide biosynthesis/export family protein [Rhodospirillaceae bacterium]
MISFPRPFQASMQRVKAVLLGVALALFLSPIVIMAPSDAEAQQGTPGARSTGYTLGQGDKVRVTVFGEEELSGEYSIDPTGTLSLPLVGGVQVGGLGLRQAEAAVIGLLSEGYLRDPRVSIEVLTYRPFYILGEVRNPGEYEYVEGMTVLTAVAIAGGFTYRADEDEAVVISHNDPNSEEREVKVNYRLQPGDVIRIEESFF